MMEKDKLKSLLDAAFEFEGMLRLALDRGEDAVLNGKIEESALNLRKTIESVYPEEKPEAEIKENKIETEISGDIFYEMDDEEEVPAVSGEISETDGVSAERQVAEKRKPVFSINDRFRFRRELFSNSDSDFNDALDMLASMDCYEEAEDYFYNNLEWDMDNPEVCAFMEIVARYFE